MSGTDHLSVPVRSTADLLAVALALETEAAARYRGFAARMAQQGDDRMAAHFDSLADMEEGHASDVRGMSRLLLGGAPDPAVTGWELPDGFEAAAGLGAPLNPYRALAAAVRNEERAFAFYRHVAAEAEDPAVRALAAELADDELEHAALLRHRRRRLRHAERPARVEMPRDAGDLHQAARSWQADAAEAHSALADALDRHGSAVDAAIFRCLAAQEAWAAEGAPPVSPPHLASAADGLQLLEAGFDRYALIGERARDQNLVAAAQRLAGQLVARLAAAGGARGNSLIAHHAH